MSIIIDPNKRTVTLTSEDGDEVMDLADNTQVVEVEGEDYNIEIHFDDKNRSRPFDFSSLWAAIATVAIPMGIGLGLVALVDPEPKNFVAVAIGGLGLMAITEYYEHYKNI